MTEPSFDEDQHESDDGGADQVEVNSTADGLSEDDYALGRTSDPDGAEREEPAGEDYAGSGF